MTRLLIVIDDDPTDPTTVSAEDFVAAYRGKDGQIKVMASPDVSRAVLGVLRPEHVMALTSALRGRAEEAPGG